MRITLQSGFLPPALLLCFCAAPLPAQIYVTAPTLNNPLTYCPSATMTSTRANYVNAAHWRIDRVISALQTPTLTRDAQGRKSFNHVVVTAHRGEWEYCPENSLEAFNAAIDLGAEMNEMDIRPSNVLGRSVLTHDYDLRGEAPGPPGRSDNNVYTTSILLSRTTVDRHGKQSSSTDVDGFVNTSLPLPMLADLLDTILARARLDTTMGGALESAPYTGSIACQDGVHVAPKLIRGGVLTLDVKGNDAIGGSTVLGMVSPYDATLQAISEVNDWMCRNGVDVSDAVIFKLTAKSVVSLNPTSAKPNITPQMFSNAVSAKLGFAPAKLPYLSFIVYPSDIKPTDQPQAFYQLIEAYRTGQAGVLTWGSRYIITSYRFQFPGVSIEAAAAQDRAVGRGIASFSGNNAFPEGTRSSDGTQESDHSQNFQEDNNSSINYLFPPLIPAGRLVPTSSTTDLWRDTVLYLAQFGMRKPSLIQ